MNQQSFAAGQREIANALACWRTMGYRSPADCRKALRPRIQHDLHLARQLLHTHRASEKRDFLEKHLAYCLGQLSYLEHSSM